MKYKPGAASVSFVSKKGSFRLSDLAQTRLKRQAGLLTASTVGLPEVEVNVIGLKPESGR
jgi:hypothetical protein